MSFQKKRQIHDFQHRTTKEIETTAFKEALKRKWIVNVYDICANDRIKKLVMDKVRQKMHTKRFANPYSPRF